MLDCRRLIATALIAALVAPTVLRAEEPAPTKPWKNETEFSFVSANGNTKSTTTSGKEKFTYTIKKTTIELFGGGLGAKNAGEVIAEQYNAGEKGSYKLSDRNYAFERYQWEKDRFAGIKNRNDLTFGLGRELIQKETDKLLAEAGGGWIDEERINSPDQQFGTLRAYMKYEHVISPTANFTQDGEYVQNLDDNEDIRVKTETALIASLSTHLSLKVSYIWKHVGVPPDGFGRNDTLTSISLLAIY